MREVARYAFHTPVDTDDNTEGLWSSLESLVEGWLSFKGTRIREETTTRIVYADGRQASLSSSSMRTRAGQLSSWILDEPTSTGTFRTALTLARNDRVVAISCILSAGIPTQVIAPVKFETHCPQVIRDIIDMPVPWVVGSTPVSTTPQRFKEHAGGANLAVLVRDVARSLPLFVVSEYDGLVLHPEIADDIARDVAGLGVVAQADDQACWQLTRDLGPDWSCYHGAIRLYWPFSVTRVNPFSHPLWTARRLLEGCRGTLEAARRIRAQLRHTLLELSTLARHRHTVFDGIERAYREELLENRHQELKDYEELARSYAEENRLIQEQCLLLQEKTDRLETDLANARVMLKWTSQPDAAETVTPESSAPPSTVSDAVDQARECYATMLTFGAAIENGIATVADNAGPPDKLFNYLSGLAELSTELARKTALGKTQLKWLKDRGFNASGESDSIRNSPAERKKRTWDDGQKSRTFDLHLKPAEGTHPDRCIRIYFDWDEAARKIVIGWIGRHP